MERQSREEAPEKDIKSAISPLERQDTARSNSKSIGLGEVEIEDPFQPLSGVAPYDGGQILTVRAVVTGAVLGTLIACSNMYLGLKSGMGADATLFSAIFGFAALKFLEKSHVPLLSGYFGPHENNIIQATALGAIGIGFMFISGIPAMYQLNLLGSNPKSDYGKLVCFAAVSGLWGLGFTVPFRKVFILRLARQLSLYFPMGSASAITIRALHSGTDGTTQAKDNVRGITITFCISCVWSVATSYAPGILYTWNPFWWIYKWGGHSIIAAVNWGWLSWSWSPSMIGMGMLIDLNASMSYLFGTVLAWGIIGPILVATGAAGGLAYSEVYPDLVTYNAFDPTHFVDLPSPRYWVLWPAVFMMLAVSLTGIALEGKNLARLVQYGGRRIKQGVTRTKSNDGAGALPTNSDPKSGTTADAFAAIPDPVPKDQQVRWWEWSSVAGVSFIISLVAFKYLFSFAPGMNILSLVLGFLWSFVVIQVYGASGTTPITVVAKGSQFITGAILRDQIPTTGYDQAARVNLLGATLSSAASQQAAELVQDFRTGFLLGTPARPQWYAQVAGTLVAVIVSPALFMLFVNAYPCIIDSTATSCQFATPAVTSWRIVTIAILSEKFPISRSSWIFSVIFSLIGVASVVLKRWLVRHATLSSWAKFVPNMSVVGLAMTIPGSTTTVTVAIGTVVAHFWKRWSPVSHARYVYPVAAGGIAGEGIGYVILCVLQIAQVGGPVKYGTTLGCVAESC
ncbi:OPT oligopeptide transporter protein-domain-containing protein [Ilyonectria sp. MPI-CAGE-AT-0026]|nr:OPT oligopeptide transporter protein-domain-containing protein [Ilyonectria sp. MPI-CAGE-AT-0026]